MNEVPGPQPTVTATAAGNEAPVACRNCGTVLTGRYCAACGQKVVNLNPTLTDFAHEVWHEMTHVDGKLIPSVRMLLTSPGALTLEHYSGRRARYLSPMRLYLVFSILFFAVTAITPNANFRITVGAEPGWNFSSRQVERRSDSEELRKLGFDSDEELQQVTSDAVKRWLPRMMFLLVPLFAALIALAMRGLQWNYPRHVHFALHLHATWFLLLTVSRLSRLFPWQWFSGVVSLITTAAIAVYFILAMRRTYSLTLGVAIRHALSVSVVYSVLLGLSLLTIILPIVLERT
jgi:hypothetical protein